MLVEFWGGTKQNSAVRERWPETRQVAYPALGGKTLWFGHCDRQIIGIAKPVVEQVQVTWFPDEKALARVVTTPQRTESLPNLKPYLAYTANSMVGFLPELR